MRPNLTGRQVSKLYGPLKEYRKLSALYEDVIHALYSAHLRPGDICVDGGAHRGLHTIPMAHLIEHGKVHAYEPIPEVAEILRQEATKARVRDQIEIHVCALADTEGERDFVSLYTPSDENPAYYSGLRSVGTPEEWASQTIRTPVTTLDRSLAGVSGLTFIKLDLEGGEYHALLGGERIISSQRPLIVFEHGHGTAMLYQYSDDDLFRLFKRLDYELVDIMGTRVTREVWERAAWIPGYSIAFPRELGSPDGMTSSINKVLRMHGFPSLYTTTMLRSRQPSERSEPVNPSHRLGAEYTFKWKLLTWAPQIVNLRSLIHALNRRVRYRIPPWMARRVRIRSRSPRSHN
jgi:FkbM family methyltransferase